MVLLEMTQISQPCLTRPNFWPEMKVRTFEAGKCPVSFTEIGPTWGYIIFDPLPFHLLAGARNDYTPVADEIRLYVLLDELDK